jgi:hypothetical protein
VQPTWGTPKPCPLSVQGKAGSWSFDNPCCGLSPPRSEAAPVRCRGGGGRSWVGAHCEPVRSDSRRAHPGVRISGLCSRGTAGTNSPRGAGQHPHRGAGQQWPGGLQALLAVQRGQDAQGPSAQAQAGLQQAATPGRRGVGRAVPRGAEGPVPQGDHRPGAGAQHQEQGGGGLPGHSAGAGAQAHRGALGRVAPGARGELLEKVLPQA